MKKMYIKTTVVAVVFVTHVLCQALTVAETTAPEPALQHGEAPWIPGLSTPSPSHFTSWRRSRNEVKWLA